MAREFAVSFYNSKAWKKCRESYISNTVDRLCERCKEPGEEVHHRMYLSPDNIDNPEITLNHNNLELLCSSCHSLEHNVKHKKDIRDGLIFNKDGELVSEKRLVGEDKRF